MEKFISLLFVMLVCCFQLVTCVAVSSQSSPEQEGDFIKTDEDEISDLKEQVHKLQQQITEIYRSFATLDLVSKNPGMMASFNTDDHDDVSEKAAGAKVRYRRDGDTAIPLPTNSPGISAADQSVRNRGQFGPYSWPMFSGQCFLCPAGIAGPRGPPGPVGMSGRDGRDGRDAALQPQEAEIVTSQPSLAQPEPQSYSIQNSSVGGVVYTRWGKPDCPESAELVYTGSVAGSEYTHTGSGANVLCMPMEPIYDAVETTAHAERGLLYSSEFETSTAPEFSALHDHTPTCAVCRAPANRVSKLMIPGRNVCPSTAWRLEYSGYLMSSRYTHKRSEFVCMDREAETVPGSTGNQNGALFYMVEVRCLAGSGLPCGPYVNGLELTCAVCTI